MSFLGTDVSTVGTGALDERRTIASACEEHELLHRRKSIGRYNHKLDKLTKCVLAAGDPLPTK